MASAGLALFPLLLASFCLAGGLRRVLFICKQLQVANRIRSAVYKRNFVIDLLSFRNLLQSLLLQKSLYNFWITLRLSSSLFCHDDFYGSQADRFQSNHSNLTTAVTNGYDQGHPKYPVH